MKPTPTTSRRPTAALWKPLLHRAGDASTLSLQAQVREMLVAAILDGQLPGGALVPSSREMANALGIARNTVVIAYQQLADDGFLLSRERSGHFVNPAMVADQQPAMSDPDAEARNVGAASRPDWQSRLCLRPTSQRSIVKPSDWQKDPYPFLYGQFDPTLFPTADWRECCMKTLSVLDTKEWAPDQIARDDDALVQQIRTRVLPRRGVWAAADELIVTVGAQHALYMVADLLMREGTRVAFEDPGYPDARNIFASRTSQLAPIAVDGDGLPVDNRLRGFDYVYVTPSHQCPTGVTMPLARREALLAMAREADLIVIEDDYESENRAVGASIPALKSMDRNDRVIYIGSLSKSLAPGLRVGYIVAAPALIAELRALRRLMLRHPSTFIQRAFALYLSLGHHDAQLRRLAVAHSERYPALVAAVAQHMPCCTVIAANGGGSCWVRLPEGIGSHALASRAARRGVLLEPGDVFFMAEQPPAGYIRLGYQSIGAASIDAGIQVLGEVIGEMMAIPVGDGDRGSRPA